ncbi:MAG: hypothetical protein QM770_09045 [Tepidisphaeraceae bacterium]
MRRWTIGLCLSVLAASASTGSAVTTTFFDVSQTATAGAPGATYDTLISDGYSFRYSVDKFWSASPGGTPTGRFFTVVWPAGVQAQAVTAGPNTGPATVTLKRTDNAVFDLSTLRVRLLANTAGAGASIEIMPLLNGNDGLPDPLALDITGYGNQVFNYTPGLSGFDTYQLSLYVDYAITGLTLVDASEPIPEPAVALLVPLALLLRRRR